MVGCQQPVPVTAVPQLPKADFENRPNPVPMANATILGKNPYLYPLMAMPQGMKNNNAFAAQSGQNLMVLQNYLASQYMLNTRILNSMSKNRPAPLTFQFNTPPPPGNPTMMDEPTKISPETKNKRVKNKTHPKVETEVQKPKRKVARKRTKKGSMVVRKKKAETTPRQKQTTPRQKPSKRSRPKAQSESSKKTKGRNRRNMSSPLTTPKRRKPHDLLGFVSLSLPTPRDVSSDWEAFKKEIVTPPWHQKKMLDVSVDEESSSEEDTSDETYYRWHTRSHIDDCKRIQELLKKPKSKSSSHSTKAPNTKKPVSTASTQIVELEKDLNSPAPKSLSQPHTYNYCTTTTPWRKPKKYICFLSPEMEREQDDSETITADSVEESQTQEPAVEKSKPRRKKKRRVTSEDTKPSSHQAEAKLASLKLQYLDLKAQLDRLHESNEDGKSNATGEWKAVGQDKEDGGKSITIRLRRVKPSS